MSKKSKKLLLGGIVGILMSSSAFAGCRMYEACIIGDSYWCFTQVTCDRN